MGQKSIRLTQRLHFTAQRNLRRLLVLRNHHVVLVAVEPPLATDQRCLGDVLRGERRHLVGTECDLANDGVEPGGTDRFCERSAIGGIIRSFDGVDGDLEQRVNEADRLGPLLAGSLFVALCEIGGADAAET